LKKIKVMRFVKSLIFVLFLNGLWLNAQTTATIDNSGNTGTTGSHWSTSGTDPVTITVTGAAHINTSVITGYLNAGTDVVISTTAHVDINNGIDASAGNGNLTLLSTSETFFYDVYINANMTLGGNLSLATGRLTTYLSPGVHLNVTGDLVVNNVGGLVLDSNSAAFSSFIVGGSISGSGGNGLEYWRWCNPNPGNDLLSSPYGNTTVGQILEMNGQVLLSGIINDDRYYLVNAYNESINDYGELFSFNMPFDGPLPAGTGYRVGTKNDSTKKIKFFAPGFGSLSTYNNAHKSTVSVPLTHTGEGWNLVGNPYPSYLTLPQVLSGNNGNLYGGVYNAIYSYNGDATNPWTIYNISSGANIKIAPGQAFFVRAAEVGSTFSFTPSMQSNTGGDDFIQGRNAAETSVYRAGIELSSSVGSYTTDVYFHPNGSNGLDVGYDAASWQGSAPDYGVYSHLVSDNQGLPIAIQTLHSDALEQDSTVIPLGVEASSGYTLTLGLTDNSYLPESALVYLEDRNLGSFTNLRTGSYSVSSGSGISGTGRFFIHVSNDATLSNPGEVYSGVQVYSPMGSGVLVVTGVNEPGMRLRLYDIQGRLLLDQGLSAVSMQELPVGTLSTAAVIARLEGAQGSRSVKLIINQK
jgi:hypothetical protein